MLKGNIERSLHLSVKFHLRGRPRIRTLLRHARLTESLAHWTLTESASPLEGAKDYPREQMDNANSTAVEDAQIWRDSGLSRKQMIHRRCPLRETSCRTGSALPCHEAAYKPYRAPCKALS